MSAMDPARRARVIAAAEFAGEGSLDALSRPLSELPGSLLAMASPGGDRRLDHDPGLHGPEAQVVAQLALPTELLLLLGSDERTEPVNGVNRYGFPPYWRDVLLQFSSCTATVPDRLALASAERHRRGALAVARRDPGQAVDQLRRQVVDGLVELLELPPALGDALILCPSGTDAEFLPGAISLHAKGRPVRNIFVGAREAGRGVPVAGAGRWPGARTALGWSVNEGVPVEGFGSDHVQVTDVDVRDSRGRARRAFDVEAEVEAHVEDALSAGCMVVVHAIEASKTGLRFLPPDWVARFQQRAPEQLSVVVDAAQGRISPARVRAFLQAGASVLLTGSKAWSGPPFSGVLIPGMSLLQDIHACESMPAGLTKTFTETDVPVGLRRFRRELLPANVGLLIRWLVALDEVRRYQRLPLQERAMLRRELTESLSSAMALQPNIELLPPPEDDASIITFAVRSGRDSFASREELTDVHRRAAAAGVFLGQPVEIAPGAPAMLRVAIGTATMTRLHERASGDSIRRVAAATVEALADELQTIRA